MPPSLLAFIAIFMLGALLRNTGLLTKQDAERLAGIVFTVSLPATILVSLDRITLSAATWKLPAAAWLVTLSMLVLAWRIAVALRLPRPTQGGFLLATGCINSVYFAYPVALATLGEAGLARTILFDLGQATLTLTVLYAVAAWHGEAPTAPHSLFARLASSPPVWALAATMALKFLGLRLPPDLVSLLQPLHSTTTPWASLVLGLSISFTALHRTLPLALLGVIVRMGGGLLLGVAVATLLDLTDTARVVVILVAAMPSAVTAVIFAAETRLDEELVASIVALSLCVGVALLPWLPFFATALTMP